MSIHKNQAMKTYCKDVFKLENMDLYILGEFAKKGATYRNRIKLAYLSERQVARRIGELNKMGFLHLVNSTNYKNSNKKNIIFGLSFKGFFASLSIIDIEKNYLVKKFLKEVDSEIHANMIEFLKNYILEFLIYHKELGITLEKSNDLATYVREILFDHSLIKYSSKSENYLIIIENEIGIIDEINDQISDLETSEERDIFDPDEEGYVESEANKHEFMINFWPNLLDEIGKGKNLERELLGFSYDERIFDIKDVKLDIKKEHKKKLETMQSQWGRRKLNFSKPFTFSWNGNRLDGNTSMTEALSRAFQNFERS
jgi:hypothetical protein